MKCLNCNETIPDGSKFCEHCGAKVGQEVEQTVQKEETVTVQNSQDVQPKKPLNKKLIAVIAAAVCVVAVVLIVIATHKKTINLNDYVNVVFSGYDGYGTAYIDFDYESFYSDMESSMKNTGSSSSGNYTLSDLIEDAVDYSGYYAVFEGIDWELDKTDSLYNGDSVTVSFEFDNDAAKKYGIKFKGDDTEYTVSGLEAIREIDPFEDVEVSFSGTSPNVYVSVTNNSSDEALSYVYFYADPSSGVSKGDTITVYADVDEEDFIELYGCRLTATSKEYMCDSVDTYITDGNDVGEDILEDMKAQTEDTIEEYFADYSDYISVSDLEYVGYYFLSAKDPGTWYSQNIIYIVYSGKVKSLEEDGFDKTTVYFPVEFTDLIQYADGTDYVDLYYTSIEGDTDLEFGWWNSVDGYESQSEMKNALVTSQKSSYNDQTFGDLE